MREIKFRAWDEENKVMLEPQDLTMDFSYMKNEHAVALGKLGGMVGGRKKSEAKAKAARENGKKGGRPKTKAP